MSKPGNQFKAKIFADTIAPIVAESLGVPAPPPSKYASTAAESAEPEVVEGAVAEESL